MHDFMTIRYMYQQFKIRWVWGGEFLIKKDWIKINKWKVLTPKNKYVCIIDKCTPKYKKVENWKKFEWSKN